MCRSGQPSLSALSKKSCRAPAITSAGSNMEKKKDIPFSYGTSDSSMYCCRYFIGLKWALFLGTGHTYLQGRLRKSWHIDTNKFSVTKEQNGCWDLCQVMSFTNMFCECEMMRHLCINLICLITTPGVDWCYPVSSVQVKAHSPLCSLERAQTGSPTSSQGWSSFSFSPILIEIWQSHNKVCKSEVYSCMTFDLCASITTTQIKF